ncbi:hypothetical protein [Marinobacter lipolyticus]|uniref:hypothetical protein n=1 Tax=Marinobacter lipolyticus TaxID=209639 RepID=UPI003A8FA600
MAKQNSILKITLIAMFLTGCASSPAELRTPENLVLDTEEDLNYQRIHRKMAECYNARFSGTNFSARMGIHEQIYSDIGESELLQYMDSAFGRSLFMATDLKKTAPEKTRVKVYVYNTAWRSWGENVNAFLRSRPLSCKAFD